ncbi:hypothetical protein M0805_006727 [Coniferiporia weirii]|nr:hypothetical protein M0805_006727 [Coniferiporia weirii]
MTWSRATGSVRALCLVIWLLVYLELSRGVLVNRTIDDQLGDSVTGVLPIYEGPPADNWQQGATCKGCEAQPDPSLAFRGTWHDATWNPGDPGEKVVTVGFTGSAVYVFIILENSVQFTTLTSLSFTIDGELVGSFVHAPTTSTDYEYNVTAYANDNLANTQHTLIMQTAGNNATLILFDYLVYSVDDEGAPANGGLPEPILNPSPTSSQSDPSLGTISSPAPTPTQSSSSVIITTPVSVIPSTPADSSSGSGKKDIGIIVGTLIGGLVAFTLVLGLLLYRYRRKKNIVAMRKKYTSYVHSGRTLTGPPETSDWGETFTGTRMSSSVLTSTHANSTHRGRSIFVQSTTMSQEQRQGRSRVTHIQSASMYPQELQARTKSAERRLDLARQAAYVGINGGLILPKAVLDLGSGQTRRHEMKPPEDIDDAEVLQKQIVLPLDEVERLLTQREMAETFRARGERWLIY